MSATAKGKRGLSGDAIKGSDCAWFACSETDSALFNLEAARRMAFESPIGRCRYGADIDVPLSRGRRLGTRSKVTKRNMHRWAACFPASQAAHLYSRSNLFRISEAVIDFISRLLGVDWRILEDSGMLRSFPISFLSLRQLK